jgi:hypothetical protein
MTLENAKRYVSDIADKCARLRTHGLLIERRVEGVLSRVLAYYKISQMEANLPDGTAIALVDSDPESRERFEWAIRQTAPHKVSLKVFATVAEAENWLLRRGDGGGGGGRASYSRNPSARKGPTGGKQLGGKYAHGFILPHALRPATRNFMGH